MKNGEEGSGVGTQACPVVPLMFDYPVEVYHI